MADGRTSAEALVAQSLDRIARFDGQVGSILKVAPDAFAQARERDAERMAGQLRGPLHGIPLLLKDNIDAAGLPTSSGCRALANAIPHGDAAITARLRAAGAIILGKTNLSEFSFEIRSRSSLGGDVRNPFAHAVTAGGSSGGTAAAVALGFAPAGIGTDTGGSIRIPAAYTGLVGLRPSHGSLPMIGIAPLAPSADTIGPIAGSVEDVALLLSVMGIETGRGGQDPAPRIGLLRQMFGTDGDIIGWTEQAAEWLAERGAILVDPVELPGEMLDFSGDHIVDLEFADAFDRYLASNFSGGAPPSLATLLVGGNFLADHRGDLIRRSGLKHSDTRAVLKRHRHLRDGLDAVMTRHNLSALLFPVSQVVPDSLENPKGGWAPELAARSGWPALSICAGVGAAGIPIGVELLARAGQEAMLLHLGTLVEQGRGPRPLPPFL